MRVRRCRETVVRLLKFINKTRVVPGKATMRVSLLLEMHRIVNIVMGFSRISLCFLEESGIGVPGGGGG